MADEENKEVAAEENPDVQRDEGDKAPTPELEPGSPTPPAPEAPEQSEEQAPVDDAPPETDNEGSPTAEGEEDTTSAVQEEATDQQESTDPVASVVEEGEGQEEADTTTVQESGESGEGQTPEAEGEPVMEDGDSAEHQASGEGAEEADPPPAEGEQHAETEAVAGTPRPEGEEVTEGDQAATEGEEGEGETAAEAAAAPTEGDESKDEAGEEGKEAEGDEKEAKEGEEEEKPEDEEQAEGEEGTGATPEAEGEESTEVKSPVPQSDTFAEGERPESPVAVGEKLSREGTPAQRSGDEYDEALGSPPVPGTPDLGSEGSVEEEEEEEEEYEEEEPEFDREHLMEKYHQCMAERQQYQDQNYQLQHKLAEYFRKKKSDDNRQEADKNVTDQEQRYLKYIANLDELRRQDAEERDIFKMQIEELKDRCQDKQDKVDDERIKFMEFKRNTGLSSINSRSGKSILPKDIEQYLSIENRKEAEVVNVRLENIKLKNKLKKKEHALKSKEELAEGLHLIDFEQLKIENQTYNEKIEERNEELLKLRKKITNTVQVLTHLKEKLQYVQAENQVQQAKLREVEELAARKRDILSRTKQARDALRIDNQKLRQNCGLLGNEPLLRDFEERKDESDDLQQKLEHLKTTHAELTLNLNGVRRKIDQVKSGH